jgi:antitoxin (DNA-binding transcriptional repressor) of toxin-antitoxin stability system
MIEVKTHEAKTQFSKLVAMVLSGEEVVVYRGDQPVVKIVPFREGSPARRRARVGTVTSDQVEYSDDAFSPLSEDELREWGI